MAIRLRVRERRQALRLSLVEVARRIGVSAAFLSQYETGKNNIGIENAKRLSIVLGIPVEELLESGVDKRPRWLDVLTERHDLSRSEQDALLSVARESPVYRGAAVLREESNDVDVEHWEMVYQSIKPYLPKCGRSEDWINKSEIRNIAVGLGVPNASCLEDILCAVDKQVDKICEGIEFRNIDVKVGKAVSSINTYGINYTDDFDTECINCYWNGKWAGSASMYNRGVYNNCGSFTESNSPTKEQIDAMNADLIYRGYMFDATGHVLKSDKTVVKPTIIEKW